jgi:uncharacterized repeat protein (TIGR04042 family)
MPEIRFQIQWPDGSQEMCYSPSLVIKEYLLPETEYALDEFLERSRTALKIASDRVMAKYGMPCSLAIGQLRRIESTATRYGQLSDPKVRIMGFIE